MLRISQNPAVIQREYIQIFNMVSTNSFAAKLFVLMENAQHLDSLPSDLKEMLSESGKLIRKPLALMQIGLFQYLKIRSVDGDEKAAL